LSKIHEALEKLRRDGSQPDSELSRALKRRGFGVGDQRSAIPIAPRKSVATDVVRHHVDQESLIAGGVLAPLDHALNVADEFRRIKRPIIRTAMDNIGHTSEHMNVIMLASAMPGAGKTFCSVNLAVSISLERELNVLLVDADVAKPHVTPAFGLEQQPGLIELLVDDSASIEELLVRTDLNDIQVLPAGHRHPQATELLASKRMSQIVDELATRYPDRIILVDSPPLLITSEAQALASQVGQIALVVEAGKTNHQKLLQAVEVLDAKKAVNVILNKSRHYTEKGGYGSYGYYGYEGYEGA
jgi:exopolysaccharide/PEP-CTERM locus tyrosine autokinase